MDTKKRILKKADELFRRYGIRSVTMDDIAKGLAISKKTIYQFFKDKDDLVYQVSDKQIQEDICTFEEIHNKEQNPLEETISIAQQMRVQIRSLNPSLLFDLQKYHPRAWKLFQEHKKSFMKKSIMDNLEKGIAEGFYRKDIHIEVLAILRIEEIQLAFDPSLFPPEKFNLIELQSQFIEHFLRGIVTEKGFQFLEEYKRRQTAEKSN